MAEPVVIDTNVLIVSNGRDVSQVAPECIAQCARFLGDVQSAGQIVIDDTFLILGEYMKKVNASGQPGVGDFFLKWVLTNRTNESRCALVHITPHPTRGFVEFPDDPELMMFDPSDRKFVAAALAHPDHPSIANATDSDWIDVHNALHRNGVRVRQLCSIGSTRTEGRKQSRRRRSS